MQQPIFIKKFKTNDENNKIKTKLNMLMVSSYKKYLPINLLKKYRIYLCFAWVTLIILFFIRPNKKFVLVDGSYRLSSSSSSLSSSEYKFLNYLQNPIESNCKGSLCGIYFKFDSSVASETVAAGMKFKENNKTATTTIIIITPTNKRSERLPDLIKFSQTLMHIKNLHWIIVEDGIKLSNSVERLLNRTVIPYAYFFAPTQFKLPAQGWTQRNEGIAYVKKYYKNFGENAVIYFGDDDNSYDIRLFDKYIRNVQTIGFWPVGLIGGITVEGPYVENGKIVKWNNDIIKPSKRIFPINIAGFAIKLNLILINDAATFGLNCIQKIPEDCFLNQFNIKKEDLQPFGYNENPKEILVWHTKTKSNFFAFNDDEV